MADFEKIAEAGEVSAVGRKAVVVDDVPALLLRVGDDYYCIEDTCTHDGQAMTDGEVHGCEITCPRHGARFDIRTGKALCMPANEPVATFEVEVRGDGIYARPRS
jgi:3-phenylpropionate/trans-cinnamate dioxygenase ferredoxin component